MVSEPPTRKVNARTVQIWLLCGARLFCQANRIVLSTLLPLIAIDLNLSSKQKGQLLSGFPLGYMFTQVLGGVASDRFGGKRVMALALCSISVGITIFARLSDIWSLWWVCFFMGFMEGPSFPTNRALLSQWVPSKEKAYATAVTDIGGPLGALVGAFCLPLLADQIGWRNTLQVCGVATVLFLTAWLNWAADNPKKCAYIQDDELFHLTMNVGKPANNQACLKCNSPFPDEQSRFCRLCGMKRPDPPPKPPEDNASGAHLPTACVPNDATAIISSSAAGTSSATGNSLSSSASSASLPNRTTSTTGTGLSNASLPSSATAGEYRGAFPILMLAIPSAWSVILAHVAFNYNRYLLYNWSMTFYTDALQIDVSVAAACMFWPNMIDAVASIMAGRVGDSLINSNRLSAKQVRRLFSVLGFIGTGVGGVLLGRCGGKVSATICLTVASGMQALHNAGFKSSYGDLSHDYSGFLSGVGNTFATASSYMVPQVAAHLLDSYGGEASLDAWNAVFITIPVCSAIGSIAYWFLVSTESLDAKIKSARMIPKRKTCCRRKDINKQN